MLKDSAPSGKQSSGTGQDKMMGDVAEALESAGVSGEVAKAMAETLKANGHVAGSEGKAEVETGNLVAGVLAFFQTGSLAVIAADDRIPESIQILRPPFPAPLSQAGHADLQGIQGIEDETSAEQAGFRHGAVIF